MNKFLGMKLLVVGSICAVVVACQPKNPKAPAATMSAQEQPSNYIPQGEKEDEDIDLHVYGTNDTATSLDTTVTLESTSFVADIHEALEDTVAPIVVADEVNVMESVPSAEITQQSQEN